MISFHISMNLVDLAILVLLAMQAGMSHILSLRRKKFFQFSIGLIGIVIAAEMVTSICDAANAYWIPNLIANLVGFSVSPFIPLVISTAFGTRLSKLECGIWIPSVVNAVMVLISPIYGLIFYVTKENVYLRGPLFMVFGIACICSLLGCIISIIRTTRRQEKAPQVILYSLAAYVFLSNSVQVIWPEFHLTWTCNTVAMLLLYDFFCEQSTRYDTVTELLNRQAYENELTLMEQKGRVAIIMFDVDNFKYVNDNYGHAFGDYCLNMLGQVITDVFSFTGNCYRIGGDEFCYLSDKVDEDFVKEKLDELINRITALRSKDKRIPMVSFGYSFYYRLMGDKLEDAVIKADEQAYVYKSQRKILHRNGRTRNDKLLENIIHRLVEAYSIVFTYNPERELCCFIKEPEGLTDALYKEIALNELVCILFGNDIDVAAQSFLKNMSYESIISNTKNEQAYAFSLKHTHEGKSSMHMWQVSPMDEVRSHFLVVGMF